MKSDFSRDFKAASSHAHNGDTVSMETEPWEGAANKESVRKFLSDEEETADLIAEISKDYSIDRENSERLRKWADDYINRAMHEKMNRLVAFMLECKIPRLVVFATLATNGDMQQVEIAKLCGISKQAVNAHFRWMEKRFARYGTFQNRRNFSDHSRNHQPGFSALKSTP